MTRRERVIAALEHRETPTVPWDINFTGQAVDNLVKYTGDPDIIKKLEADRRYFEDALVMQPDLAAAKANCDKLKKLEEAIKQEIERLKQEQNEQ